MANKRIMAARAAANPTITGRHAQVPVLAPSTALAGGSAAYQGSARKAPRLTSTQRDSTGRRSAWNRSPYTPKGGWR